MKQNIVFIIIAYHPDLKTFRGLLASLSSVPVVVIDNGQSLTKKDVGKATLLTQSRDLCYGAGANVGIRHALAHGAVWCVVLNDDLVISPEAVARLSRELSKIPPCIAGPFGGGLDPNRWSTLLPSAQTDYISGSCIAIHRDVITKIGYFWEQYFFYYEEVDYCVKAKRAGFDLRCLGSEGIFHEDAGNLGKGSFTHQYYLTRNHMLFVERLAPFRVRMRNILRLPKTIVEYIIRRQTGALMGLRDYFLRRFGPYRGRGA